MCRYHNRKVVRASNWSALNFQCRGNGWHMLHNNCDFKPWESPFNVFTRNLDPCNISPMKMVTKESNPEEILLTTANLSMCRHPSSMTTINRAVAQALFSCLPMCSQGCAGNRTTAGVSGVCKKWGCTCQGLSDTFGTFHNNWGGANYDRHAKSFWMQHGCRTFPQKVIMTACGIRYNCTRQY